ncbi:hypothetical protein GFS24_09810 [Chitinophaga sp. SYP-B3965]|uniref:RagB/SusD family nutrient uptake outer membrane protein n=1 Tax=Chitinophaga sp. SYP-B3965 TaxID=2663120 RepID=UPI0012998349|nr:RagB/SusD family nutrient uptake outer membrane protein [Chitinophaga sp. SYP-B3965]MRG45411.1 hypothetical protein [Chitinophaga sp. SYP-B3965]
MKKITITTILLSTLAFTGCKKWLEVTPQATTTKDELFQTQKGFRDALTGAYIHMKSGNTYGGGLTWGNIEFMARNWDVINVSNTALTNLANANYSDATVRGWMDGTYADEYKVVADVNSILERIDEKKSVFTGDNYALVKGEALALRAFAHFDVLRMFGPMPDNPGTIPVLPYVKKVSKEIVMPVPFQEFALSVLADLDEAEGLLKDVDPFTQYSLAELNPDPNNQTPVLADNYYMYRQLRMNYYAVLALKARVYMWLAPSNSANFANAAKYAKMVIDAKDRNGVPTFRLGKSADRTAGDYTMSPEHIIGLSMYDLAQKAIDLFYEKGSLARSDFNIQDGYYYLNNLFPPGERIGDIRWQGMWSYKVTQGSTSFVMNAKYLQRQTLPILQVPLLRLSEMYLILTESAPSKAEAEGFYATYCAEKGIPFLSGFNATNWEADRKNKMIREYVREFFAEGQTFFTYKRYNVITLPASWTAVFYSGTTARYIVPKPDREINYHNN